MFKIEGIKIVCSFFTEREAQVKDSKTGWWRCPGGGGTAPVLTTPTPSTLNSSWKVKTKRPFQWRPQEQHQCPLHFQAVPGEAPKSPWITRALLDRAWAAGQPVSMPFKVLALCPQTKKEGRLILGEKRLFSLNRKAQFSKAKVSHGSFT